MCDLFAIVQFFFCDSCHLQVHRECTPLSLHSPAHSATKIIVNFLGNTGYVTLKLGGRIVSSFYPIRDPALYEQ